MTRSQSQRLLDLLRSQGEEGVGFFEALDIVGSSRLAARIHELREAGHDIETRWETTPTKKRVAVYRLREQTTLWPGR